VTTTGLLSGVPGILSAEQLRLTGEHVRSMQLASGQVPWFVGGHCDPWNQVESAMALTAAGHLDEARRAYRWLAETQLGDGSWFNYYLGERVKDARLDTNVCAYVSAGLYHYLLATGDVDFVAALWPRVERAIDFVLRWQLDDGTIRWSLDALGRPESYALLTGSSSIYHSLRCAVALAERLDLHRPDWELAAGRLGDDGWERHVMDDYGVRCVSTSDWVTAAETAECVLALDALGQTGRALELFACTSRHRREDGAYWTGIAYPERVTFPHVETTSYTSAAIILAADALTSSSPAAGLFRHGELATPPDLAEAHCPLLVASQHP
jgi:hypothetical protein